MNATQTLINTIKHINYQFVLDNKDPNEKTGYAYERLIAEELSKTLSDLRKTPVGYREIKVGKHKGEQRPVMFVLESAITHEVRIKGNVQAAASAMPDNSFKLAPFGERSPVDLIAKINGEVVALECKSVASVGSKPEWNDNPPKADFLYAFIREGSDRPVFKLGKEIINVEQRAALIELSTLFQNLNKTKDENEFELLVNKIRDRKFSSTASVEDFGLYIRRKFEQTQESFDELMA